MDGYAGHLDLGLLDPERVPVHLGIIMDGNGRWAAARNLPRTAGHAAGEAVLFDCVEGALAVGLRWLSAYTFSTENWAREADEVAFLMWFNEDILLRRLDSLNRMGVRLHFAGDLADPRIPERNRIHMNDAVTRTRDNERLDMVLAFNYGGRAEIVRAVRALADEVTSGRLDAESITERDIAAHMFVPGMPDPDVIVRTSGGDANLELPAVGKCLCRTGFHRDPLAGLRRPGPRRCDHRVPDAEAAVRWSPSGYFSEARRWISGVGYHPPASPDGIDRMAQPTFDMIVNLAKKRGFVFQASEIYGGLRSAYDYGPLGVALLRNVKAAWWRSMVQLRTMWSDSTRRSSSRPWCGRRRVMSPSSTIRWSNALPATRDTGSTSWRTAGVARPVGRGGPLPRLATST